MGGGVTVGTPTLDGQSVSPRGKKQRDVRHDASEQQGEILTTERMEVGGDDGRG